MAKSEDVGSWAKVVLDVVVGIFCVWDYSMDCFVLLRCCLTLKKEESDWPLIKILPPQWMEEGR